MFSNESRLDDSSDFTNTIATDLSLKRLAAIVETSEDAIISKSLDGIIQSWNKAAEIIFGYSTEEMIGEPVTILMPDDCLHQEADFMARLAKGERIKHFETKRKRRDGTIIDVSLSLSPIVNQQGVVIGAAKIVRDITAAKEKERYQSILAAIVDSSDDAIISKNLDGIIQSWNRGAELIFGYQAFEMIGQHVSKLIPADRLAEEVEIIRSLRASKRVSQFETVRRRKNGELIEVSLTISPIIDEKGKVIGASKIARDISTKKQYEKALVEAKQKLETANRNLLAARDEALAASKMKSQFVANMSHEIRTPMNGILGMCNILLRSDLTDEQRDCAILINDAGTSLLTILNDILDYSKIESGRIDFEKKEFSPIKLVEGVCQILATQAHAKNLSLMTYIDPALPDVLLGDENRLRQVLINLTNNAIKFSDSGEILVRAMREGAGSRLNCDVVFSVTDNGIGITQADQEQLFQPFVQVYAENNRRAGGTGLGLSISKRLIELMHGAIGVESTVGAGSMFWCRVPFNLAPLDEKNTEKAMDFSGQFAPDALKSLQNLRVLIVDDEPFAQETLFNYLSHWGLRPNTVSEAALAMGELQKAHRENDPYTLAIIDSKLPDLDGISLRNHIQADSRLKDLKTVLLSFGELSDQEKENAAAQFAAVLAKPVRQSELRSSIVAAYKNVAYRAHQKCQSQRQVVGEAMSIKTQNRQAEPSVLIVDDQAINQRVAQLYLDQLGLAYHTVSDGKQAIQALKTHSYSLILMDCQMPEMDGLEATRKIRALESSQKTAKPVVIIAMTAHAMEGDRQNCIAAGMNDYLSKPIELKNLKNIIEKYLT